MKKEIEMLRTHFKTYKALAEEVGVSYRRLLQIRRGDKPGKPLEIVLRALVERIKD